MSTIIEGLPACLFNCCLIIHAMLNLLRKLRTPRQPTSLLVLAAPGVGKGTYARLLRKDLAFNYVSPANEMTKILQGTIEPHFEQGLVQLIRETVKESTIDSAPTDIYLRLIQEKLKEKESARGVVLDGYPDCRAELQEYLGGMRVDLALHITQRQDILLEKMLGRRVCGNCGYGYNLADIQRDDYAISPIAPKVPGVCDNCSHPIGDQPHEQEGAIRQRLSEYEAETTPMLQDLERAEMLLTFEVRRGVKDYPEMRREVEARLATLK